MVLPFSQRLNERAKAKRRNWNCVSGSRITVWLSNLLSHVAEIMASLYGEMQTDLSQVTHFCTLLSDCKGARTRSSAMLTVLVRKSIDTWLYFINDAPKIRSWTGFSTTLAVTGMNRPDTLT